jgi:hypothetical protein
MGDFSLGLKKKCQNISKNEFQGTSKLHKEEFHNLKFASNSLD